MHLFALELLVLAGGGFLAIHGPLFLTLVPVNCAKALNAALQV